MLLFRPILSQFCLPQSNPTEIGTAIDESLAERMILQCSTLCLRTAHDMIDLIYTNLDIQELRGPLPAWWYSVLCKPLLQRVKTLANDGRYLHSSNSFTSCTLTACHCDSCFRVLNNRFLGPCHRDFKGFPAPGTIRSEMCCSAGNPISKSFRRYVSS